jgi:hypothetical protein
MQFGLAPAISVKASDLRCCATIRYTAPTRVPCLGAPSDDRTQCDERCFSPQTFGALVRAPDSD